MIKILIRFGDLMLKGRNIRVFVNKLNENIKFKLKDLDVKIEKLHDRTIIHADESIKDEVIKRLKRVPGIHSYSIIYIDRKSTRLNSSHVRISYAVFCLKKKT